MQSDHIRDYRKLMRKDRFFHATQEQRSSADELMAINRKCVCVGGDKACEGMVDEYLPCGTKSGNSEVKYYLRSPAGSQYNPTVIYVYDESLGTEGCYTKGDRIDCSDAEGRVLSEGDWQKIPDDCNNSNCHIEGDYWTKWTICDDAEGKDNEAVPQTIFVYGSILPDYTPSSECLVLYNSNCYEFFGTYAPISNETIVPTSEIQLLEQDGCANANCTGCCTTIATDIDLLVTALKERLKFANGGALPGGVVGHDFDSAAYILNKNAMDVDGESALCYQRYETFRDYFVELDYWFKGGYLYGGRTTGTHEQVWATDPTSPMNHLTLAFWNALIDGTGLGGATQSVEWFRTAFYTNGDGDQYTAAGTYNLGAVDDARFDPPADGAKHVLVLEDGGNPADGIFCTLLASTIDRFEYGLTLLVCVADISVPNIDCDTCVGYRSNVAGNADCDTAAADAVSTAPGEDDAWSIQQCPLACQDLLPGQYMIRQANSVEKIGQYFQADAKFTHDLSWIENAAGAEVRVYLFGEDIGDVVCIWDTAVYADGPCAGYPCGGGGENCERPTNLYWDSHFPGDASGYYRWSAIEASITLGGTIDYCNTDRPYHTYPYIYDITKAPTDSHACDTRDCGAGTGGTMTGWAWENTIVVAIPTHFTV